MAKLQAPNHTQVPNAFFALLPLMSEAEVKVSLVIARETFGWHRQEQELSLSKLMLLTGLSRQGVLNGVEAGSARGTIERTAHGQSFYYRLLVNEVDQLETPTSQRSRPVLVNEVDQLETPTSQRSRPVLVNEVDRSLVNEVDQPYKEERNHVKKIKERGGERAPAPARASPAGLIDHPVMVAYWNQFRPESLPAIGAQDRAIRSVIDLTVWQATLDYWRDNHYRPESLGKMVDRYLEQRGAGTSTGNRLPPKVQATIRNMEKFIARGKRK